MRNQILDIVITTFEKRLPLLDHTLGSIRQHLGDQYRIILIVNGEINKDISDGYIHKVFDICVKYKNIIPHFFTEFRSLSKLWNTGCILSNRPYQLILNDDISILGNFLSNIQFDDINNILLINNSFSHFFINKMFLQQFGYFNERFLGIGSEDSDFEKRYISLYEEKIPSINITSISHNCSFIITDNLEHQLHEKYSNYNRMLYNNNDKYMNPYPLEAWHTQNKHMIIS